MKFRSLLTTAGLTAAALLGLVAPAHADAVPSNCTGARQLGATAYVKNSAGTTLASVKQYYGVCAGTPKNWSYVFVWQSFFDTGRSYTIGASILANGDSRGFKGADRPTREITSYPVATTGECTRAWGGVSVGGTIYDAVTALDC